MLVASSVLIIKNKNSYFVVDIFFYSGTLLPMFLAFKNMFFYSKQKYYNGIFDNRIFF